MNEKYQSTGAQFYGKKIEVINGDIAALNTQIQKLRGKRTELYGEYIRETGFVVGSKVFVRGKKWTDSSPFACELYIDSIRPEVRNSKEYGKKEVSLSYRFSKVKKDGTKSKVQFAGGLTISEDHIEEIRLVNEQKKLDL